MSDFTNEMQNKRDKRKSIIVELVNDSLYVPMKEKELASFLGVAREDRDEFRSILSELMCEGKLMLTQKGKYMKSNGNALTGTFTSNAKGFGFVTIEGQEEDYFIPEEQVNGAFHKDIVEIAPLPAKKGAHKEARVIRIVQRGITQIVGTYEKAKDSYGFIIPDMTKLPCDVFVTKENSMSAVTGQKVICDILDYGSPRKNPEGKIVEILGHINDPGVDIISIVKGFNIPCEFPEKVMNQAVNVAKDVSEADMQGRRDLRNLTMVTIDGEDAKDLDDAVSLHMEDELYCLGVHIADVSNYVQENSALDREAIKRGTSVYLVDRVIPMLPHVLSNGICSLNAGEDRLALSCLMKFDKTGNLNSYEICESVINVNMRMSYPVVAAILDDNSVVDSNPDWGKYKELVPMFNTMAELSTILREKRKKRGAIDFDTTECKIKLNDAGKPVSIEPYVHNRATDLIEDFMLAANETVAEHFYWMETPFVYRVHATPEPEKLARLSTLINNFGIYMKTVSKTGAKTGSEEIHPKEIQKLLSKIAGTPEEPMITRMALRSMMQAKYSTECDGHFGLACKYYCHFTSPIRRYPDLQIHRIIKDSLRGRMTEEKIAHYRAILETIAKSCSENERRADEAERETDKLKKAEYMEKRIGEIYDGIISGVTGWGIYVELENTVEGLVHISKIPGDFYVYNESKMELVGNMTGKTYKLGMPVKVKVIGADIFTRTIDFDLYDR